MGSSSSSVVVFIITIFMLLSLYFSNIFIASSSLGVQKLYLVEKVSGKDEKGGVEARFFRALLGLTRFQGRRRRTSTLVKHLSPSPSPAPSPSPSPTPRAHRRSHFPLYHSKPKAPTLRTLPKEQVGKKGLNNKVLMAVLFSSGAAFLICLLGSIWLIRGKLKRHKRVSFKTMSVHRRRGRIRGKMSPNPDLDFLYLDAIGMDLEQQTANLKQTSQGSNTIFEREESNQELIVKLESENNTCGSSSTREIMSVHEEVELDSAHNQSPSEDRIDHSSDEEESFHSFVDDLSSSNTKLSNASSVSLVEVLQDSSQKIRSPSSPSPSHSKQSSSSVLPPPPPPPPPAILLPRTRFLTPNRSSKTMRTLSRALGSPKLLKSHSSGSPQRSRREHSQSPRLSRTTSPRLRAPPPPLAPPPPPPPPPPPSSSFNGNSSSSNKGPPPSQLLPPMGKDGTPLTKLKPLHWDKVRATPDGNMVWDKIRSSSFELDEEMIESLFGYNLQSPMKSEEGKSKSKSPSPSKHVLDPKRLQNITILSKAVNSTADQVCDALIRGDGLSQQQLEGLWRMVPTKEEEAKLCGYKGESNELGSAEKFVRVLLSVPFAFPRVEAMLYRETFEDEVVHLRNSFSMLEEACKELRSSRLFLKLLEAVLKTGNRMNVGTIRGGAKAFKLDALLKLADVKGTDGKTTLLHFVVQEIIRSEGIRVSDGIMGKINQKNNKSNNSNKTPEEKEEDYKRMGLDLVSSLTTELYNVKKTATVDLELLTSSVSHLSDGMARLKQLVGELGTGTDADKNERFVATMKGFLGHGERALRELREDEEKVFLRVREVTEYFHGENRNVSKNDEANPLRIFVIVRDFLGMLDHVCKELRSLKVPTSPNPLAPFR